MSGAPGGPTRPEAQAFGPPHPTADNKTADGRAKNRRVDFIIIDPPQAEGVKSADPQTVQVPASPDQSDKSDKAAKPAGGKKRSSKKPKGDPK